MVGSGLPTGNPMRSDLLTDDADEERLAGGDWRD